MPTYSLISFSLHAFSILTVISADRRRQADEIGQQIDLLVDVFIRGLERGGTFAHAGTTTS
ncbi:hypothetical protein ACFSQQ_23455 [Mesorhizobium kowhaii]|uniref:hypothetical protein n=1 Tax=Mesorhizobium kowhaii TaxID=1300272 RepID=UPI0035E759E2